MLTFRMTGDEKMVAFIEGRGPKIVQALARKMESLMLRLQQHIVADKLSGQVLNQRTGKLIGSIRVLPVVTETASITGAVEGAGGPAFYGKFHEYGTTDSYRIVPVKKLALAFMLGGKQVIVRSVLHPPIKERSFMRSSLADMTEQIRAELQAAAREALRAD